MPIKVTIGIPQAFLSGFRDYPTGQHSPLSKNLKGHSMTLLRSI